jgi:hypothetical protein
MRDEFHDDARKHELCTMRSPPLETGIDGTRASLDLRIVLLFALAGPDLGQSVQDENE